MEKSIKVLTIAYLAATGSAAALSKITVDLEYALHEPSIVKAPVSGRVCYNFTNIRYAAPPLESLRFAAPQPPLDSRSAGLQDGSYGNICPQAFPSWLITALTVNQVEYYNCIGAGQTESEDCLFLDVVVPQKVLHKRRYNGESAPVLIWLYGGGWVSGDKRSLTNPIGLLESGRDDLIFVAPNYRLGSFGFLAGDSFISQGGTPNIGLLDQKATFEWVQKYIHLFGGDPTNVSVMGESAGAGSILYHLAALSSHGTDAIVDKLFRKVIAQSPVILPHTEADVQDEFGKFLRILGVDTLEEVKSLSTEKLMRVNQELIENTYYASYPLGPAVSGAYVTAWPNHVLATRGSNIPALVGHNSHEGELFVDPSIQTNAAFDAYVSKKVLSFLSPEQIDHVIELLYPPAYDGSNSYTNIQERLALLIEDAFINCNAYTLAKHTTTISYEYVFDVPTGLHGQDIAYTFYTPGLPSPFVDNNTVAIEMQGYLTRFAKTGDPNSHFGAVQFPDYQPDANVLNINEKDFKAVRDDIANERCRWWVENIR